MDEKQIEIVGAGPAGLTAAIVLRRAGYAVKVYEERKDVGLRFHGDFQGLENWSEEEDVLDQLRKTGITINFRCAPFYGGTLYGPSREGVEVRSDRPLFYLVRRGPVEDSLDRGLKAQALAAGVEIEFGRKMDKIHGTAITATGPKGADVIAKGVTFETDLSDRVLGIFDDRLSPGGYCYLLVYQGRATMATVLFREFRRERECFERMKEVFQGLVSFKMENPREFGGIGNFFLRTKEGHGSHLYIGECGGFQDLLWGYGIRYAVTSGYEAAQSIIEGRAYDTLLRDQLLPRRPEPRSASEIRESWNS